VTTVRFESEDKYDEACALLRQRGDRERLQLLRDVWDVYLDYRNFYMGNYVEWLEKLICRRIDEIVRGEG